MHSLVLAALTAGRWAAIVLPADAGDQELAQNLSDVLVAHIADRTHAELVGREELRAQLGLNDRNVLSCAGDTACLGRVGVQLKVDKMVVGTVSRGVGDEYVVNLTLIDVAQLRAERGELRKVHGLPALVSEVQSIATAFTSRQPLPPPTVGAPPQTGTPPGVQLGEVQPVGVHERPARYRTAAWTLVIGGGASFAAGIVVGLAARGKGNDLQAKASTTMPPLFDANLQKIQTDGQNLQKASNLLLGVGVIAAVTGGVLFYAGRPVMVTTDGRGVALAGRF
ncbi:MAG TPA: hypothetical protein VKN99_09735 [Polyangia bacterium]|nr:hypothetical protein [Polyangia bacterium]